MDNTGEINFVIITPVLELWQHKSITALITSQQPHEVKIESSCVHVINKTAGNQIIKYKIKSAIIINKYINIIYKEPAQNG